MVPARLLVALVLLSSSLSVATPPGPRAVPADDVPYQLLINPGLEEYDAPYGQFQGAACQVAGGWQPFWVGEGQPCWTDTRVFAASPLGGGSVEKIEGKTSQMVLSTEPYDAGVWQQVGGLVPGRGYGFHAAMLTIFQTSAQEAVDDTMFKQVGIDPTGGTDPQSPNVVWSPPDGHDQGPWDVDSATAVHAQSLTLTVFIRVNSLYPSGPPPFLNLSFLDSAILAETATVAAVAPALSADASFEVRWDNAVASPGGRIRWYDVQWLDEAEGTWHDWLVKEEETRATFAGMLGHAYRFRARVWQKYPNGAHLFSPYAVEGDARTCVACPAVTGRVLGHDGLPLVGATVALSGTVYAAASQADGAYSLTIPTSTLPGNVTASLAGWSSPPPVLWLSLLPHETLPMTFTLSLPGDALVNGDFENGLLKGWTAGPGVGTVSAPVHTGLGGLLLAGDVPTAAVSQTTTIAGAWEPAFAFWYRPQAAGPGDSFRVTVTMAAAADARAPLTYTLPVTTTHVVTPSLAPAGTWQFLTWQPGPPGALLTGTVTVEFELLEDGQEPVAAVYLDEVRLAPTPGGPYKAYLPLLSR